MKRRLTPILTALYIVTSALLPGNASAGSPQNFPTIDAVYPDSNAGSWFIRVTYDNTVFIRSNRAVTSLEPDVALYVDQIFFPADFPHWIMTWTQDDGVKAFVDLGQVKRRLTEVGLSGRFAAGEGAAGFRIQLDDGSIANECAAVNMPMSGTVTDGVIGPFVAEMNKLQPCTFTQPNLPTATLASSPQTQPSISGARRATGTGGIGTFSTGEPVTGNLIVLADGRINTNQGCFLPNAPTSGKISNGVVFPADAEKNLPVCNFGPVTGTRNTGSSGVVPFGPGVPVAGDTIVYDNGFRTNQCLEADTPRNGTDFGGIVFPFIEEITNLPRCPRP